MASILIDLRKKAACEKGISLVVVLWVLALLMIIATELVYTARVDGLSTTNFRDETSAESLARAGINRAIAEIAVPYKLVALDAQGSLRFIREDDHVQEPNPRQFDLGEGRVEYIIEDENGKINLNKAPRESVANLLKISGLEGSALDTVADSTIDWRDANHEHQLNGAEDDFYQTLQRPYGAKDGPFDTIEELLLVKGMDSDIFYGIEKNNDPNDDFTTKEFKGIYKYLTVRGEGKININTADEKVLKAVYGEGKTNEILLRRETEGYFELPSFEGVVSSNIFSIVSTGIVNGLRFKIRSIVEKDGNDIRVVYWNEEGISAD